MKIILALLLLCTTLSAQVPCVAIDADLMRPKGQPMIRGQIQPSFLWGRTTKFWPQRKVLSVKFMDGSRSQQEKAWVRFQKVDALVNLTFTPWRSGISHIRCGFRNSGHWSYLGRDCLSIPSNQPTMNLQLSSSSSTSEWDRVGIHETLHAIGLSHELQHPHASIPWNVPAVLSYYRQTQGWSDAMIHRQVLDRASASDFRGTVFDKDSIMAYPVPRAHVTDPAYVIGWNYRISPSDAAFLHEIYP